MGDSWVDVQEGVAFEIYKFFQNLYTRGERGRPIIENLDYSLLPTDKAQWLERPFELSEVKDVVFNLEEDKAPGPDGFTTTFY